MAKESQEFFLVTTQKLISKRRKRRKLIWQSPVFVTPFFEESFKYHYKKVTKAKHCRRSIVVLGWKVFWYIYKNDRLPNLHVVKNKNFFPTWRANRAKKQQKKFLRELVQTLRKFCTYEEK